MTTFPTTYFYVASISHDSGRYFDGDCTGLTAGFCQSTPLDID
ncbi:hypothetical protein AB6A23_02605 [Paenibacillus tarimensis]